ncbi:MAG: hypothetical protein R6X15_00960 [Pseudomonadota bacterium]
MGRKKRAERGADNSGAAGTIRVTVDCHNSPNRLHFDVDPHLPVHALVKQVLDLLAEGENAEHVNMMRRYYSPVLELVREDSAIPLSSSDTIRQAGIADQSLCRIAAEPRKDRFMFCSKP